MGIKDQLSNLLSEALEGCEGGVEAAPVQIRPEAPGIHQRGQQLGFQWSQPSIFIKPKFLIPSLAHWPQNSDKKQLASTSNQSEQNCGEH